VDWTWISYGLACGLEGTEHTKVVHLKSGVSLQRVTTSAPTVTLAAIVSTIRSQNSIGKLKAHQTVMETRLRASPIWGDSSFTLSDRI
jgi:hypothetical protein